MIEIPLVMQLPVLLAATAVHELGHVVAALAVGFRVTSIRVGPMSAVASPSGWRLRFAWRLSLDGEMVPDPVRADRLRRRHAIMIAGGPVAHLLLAGGAAAAAATWGGFALWLTALMLLLVALANLAPVPLRRGGRWRDGRWLLAWLAEPERAARRVGLGALQRQQEAGVRPRDWDAGWARLASGGPRQPADRAQVTGCLLAYARAFDRGEVEDAAALLARAFAGRRLLPERDASAAAIENAFFVASCRGNHGLGARMLEVEAPRHAGGADLERARAAVPLAAGRPAEALAACYSALVELERPRRRTILGALLDREIVVGMADRARTDLRGTLPPLGEGRAGVGGSGTTVATTERLGRRP
jgi:hypothetical protein